MVLQGPYFKVFFRKQDLIELVKNISIYMLSIIMIRTTIIIPMTMMNIVMIMPGVMCLTSWPKDPPDFLQADSCISHRTENQGHHLTRIWWDM